MRGPRVNYGVGIDPGKQGTITVLNVGDLRNLRKDPSLLSFLDLLYHKTGPLKREELHVEFLLQFFRGLEAQYGGPPLYVALEVQAPRAHHRLDKDTGESVKTAEGTVSVASTMMAYGILKATVLALGYVLYELTPQNWKPSLGLTREKESSVKLAEKMFAGQTATNMFRSPRGRLLDGRAESALIGVVGWRLVRVAVALL